MGNATTVVDKRFRKSTGEKQYAKKTIGSKGGILAVKGHGVVLNIPSRALTSNNDIRVQLLSEDLPEEFTTKDEVSLCPTVRCTPSGLTFHDPIQLTLTHCAELTEQAMLGECELLLYSRETGQAGSGNQNITRTQLTPPLCEFFDDKIIICVKKLGDFWIRIKTTLCKGKRIGCLPFVPMEMPRTRKPILRCYVYDLTEGHGQRIAKEEYFFGFKQPMTPQCDLTVKSTKEDLQIVVKDKKRQQFRKNVKYEDILHLERNVIFVELDYSKKPENDLNVGVEVVQGQRNKASLQFRTILQAAKKIEYDSDDELDSKSKKKKRAESIDDDLLFAVADEIDNGAVLESLMQALDVGSVTRKRCLEINRSEEKVSRRGTRDMLLSWRAKTEVEEQKTRLESALTKAELDDLRDKLFKVEAEGHFRNI